MMRKLSIMSVLLVSCISAAHADKDDFLVAMENEINFKEAYSFVDTAEKRGLSVGVELLKRKSQKRLFGAEFDKKGVPLLIALTNDSRYRILMHGADLKLQTDGSEVGSEDLEYAVSLIDPSDADSMGKALVSGYFNVLSLGAIGLAQGDSEDQVRQSFLRNNLQKKTLNHRIVEPGETALGVAFFPHDALFGETVKDRTLRVKVQNLKRVAYLEIAVPLTNLAKEKSRFGW